MKRLLLLTGLLIGCKLTTALGKGTGVLGFIENKGQIIDQNNLPNPKVKYLWNGGGMKLQLRDNAFSYEVLRTETLLRRNPLSGSMLRDKKQAKLNDSIVYHSHRVDVSLINANSHPELVAEETQTEVLNYYTTGTPEEGVTNVHQYGKVTYKNIYPNIDLEFETSNNAAHPFKYNFIVHPGGDVNAIQLHYEGADGTALKQGSIQITTANGKLEEAIPASFTAENSKSVNVKYQSFANNTYGFKAGKYPASQTLVIDPWATYFGWTDSAIAISLALDAERNIFTTGWTEQVQNVATSGTFQTVYAGNKDAFVRKWNTSGFPIWCTFYGGSEEDVAESIVCDVQGNIFIGGKTLSSSNIATVGSFIDTYQLVGGTTSFTAKLSPNGSRFWGTYLNIDISPKLVLDNNGDLYIAGPIGIPGMATIGAHQVNYGGGLGDAFLIKFNTNGTRLWATYYGGSDNEYSLVSIAVDGNNNIYLCGVTFSTNNIASPGAFQTVYGGAGDVFIAKFNSSGMRQWGTYYGGNSNEDNPPRVSADPFGNIYVTGVGASLNFFATPGAFQMNPGGVDRDYFLSKFSGSGQRIWSTYFGGNHDDQISSLTTDKNGNVIFSGYTESTDVIATPGAFQDTFGGVSLSSNASDGFIEKFSPSGSRLWGTFLGSADWDEVVDITTDVNSNIIFTAITTRSNIATPGAYHTTLPTGATDSYLASFDSSGTLTTPVPELLGPATSLIKVFPNPTNDIVQVTLPSMSEGSITISDAMGRVVKTVAVKTQELTIDLKGLAAGVYLLEYKSEQMSETVKLIKE